MVAMHLSSIRIGVGSAVMPIVVRHGGEWIIVPGERMPTQTGVAAIYRY